MLSLVKDNLTSLGYPSTITEEKLKNMMKAGAEVFIFETIEGKPIGFIGWTFKQDTLYIDLCVIEKTYRDKGILTAAIEPITAYIKQKSMEKVQLTVDAKNENAYRLYKRIGFKVKHKNTMTGKILMEMPIQN
nr:GNAT family N-acetyltransferase [Bacillus sp. 165]